MIYDYTVTTGTGEQLNLAEFRGKVIMVVNTATGCGFRRSTNPSSKCTEITTIRDWRFWIFPATSLAGRHPERMMKSMSSAPCISTRLFRR